jgi:alginate O-acetyltransferase complex protein AlgJ
MMFKVEKIFHQTIIGLFLVLLCLPSLLLILSPKKDVAVSEKRKLAAFPEISFKAQSIRDFPAAFETYFNDHFGGRQTLIRWHHYIKAMWLKSSPVKKVMMGKDGWLFYTENKMLESFRGANPFTGPELMAYKRALEKRQNVLARQGIRYLFVIAPNKQSIYPEYLPDRITRVGRQSRLDQLLGFLNQYSTVEFLDLREPLRSRKKDGLLYLTKDTHWNQQGAFIAYQDIIKRLNRWFPALKPLSDEDVQVEVKISVRGDLAGMLSLRDELPENAPFVGVKKKMAGPDNEINKYLKAFDGRYSIKYHRPFARRNEKGTHRVVVFRDSFFTDIIPFLSESFGQAVYFYEPFNYDLFFQLALKKFKPDVVIEEIIARNL